MVELTLNREYQTSDATLGRLFWENEAFCFTLEDIQRRVKIAGRTAIPCGRYKVVITFSNRFQKHLPLLLDVPGFTGIRIHSGNTDKDTEGCILLGAGRYKDRITNSRVAVNEFIERLKEALKEGHVWLTIQSAIEVSV